MANGDVRAHDRAHDRDRDHDFRRGREPHLHARHQHALHRHALHRHARCAPRHNRSKRALPRAP